MGEEAVPTLDRALATRMAHLRARESLTLDDVATGARSLGLAWTRATVWAIEKVDVRSGGRGTKRLSVGEFLLLPMIFERASAIHHRPRTFTLDDFRPRDDEVSIAGVVIPRGAVQALMRGSSINPDLLGHTEPRVGRAPEKPLAR